MSEWQPFPEMQNYWDDKGQSKLEEFGTNTNELGRMAAGFSGDEAAKLARIHQGALKTVIPADVHGGNLEEDYADVNAEGWAPQEFQVGDLSKTEDRMKILDKLTQNAEGAGVDANGRCSTTALMAAAIHGGGNDGIKTILDAVKSGADPKDAFAKAKFKSLEEKMNKGELDQNDLSGLNDELYYQLRLKQNDMFKKEKQEVPASGLDPRVLQEFIAGNKNMTEYFKDGKMSIDSVDTDGKGGSEAAMNHYVLTVGGQNNNFVYDPQARKDGHQVVTNQVDVQNYHQKEWKPDRIDAADFGGTPFDGMYE